MKRITILTGHYGSGKSEIAVNLALKKDLNTLVDLDVINPYFRSRSFREHLEKHGVDVIESTIENATGSDLPFISSRGSRAFVNTNLKAVYDLGGTKHGAKLMKQFDAFIKNLEEIDFLMVVNIYRPETVDVEKILATIDEIEGASQLRITGLINNTNLMDDTTEAMIKKGERILQKVGKIKNIPIVYTCVEENVEKTKKYQGEVIILRRYLAEKAHVIGGKHGKR